MNAIGVDLLACEVLKIMDALVDELAEGISPSTAAAQRWQQDLRDAVRICETIREFCE